MADPLNYNPPFGHITRPFCSDTRTALIRDIGPFVFPANYRTSGVAQQMGCCKAGMFMLPGWPSTLPVMAAGM